MEIEYDPDKRLKTLTERGLDFEDAPLVLDGPQLTRADDRYDYGEERLFTVGQLRGAIIVVVWTRRNDRVRIISMRMAHDHERRYYQEWLERSR